MDAMRLRGVPVVLLLGVVLAAPGCASGTPLVRDATQWHSIVRVQDRWLLLHLSRPLSTGTGHPLVIFVTGDGGWRGKDLDAFNHLASWGYPVAAFSAPDYLNHLAHGAGSIHPSELARDLAGVIETARGGFGLSAREPVLLTGISRGADLVVVAAAQSAMTAPVAGVLAIALTREEEYVRHHRRWRPGDEQSAASDGEELVMAAPYALLAQVRAPVCVIQSDKDEYVSAVEARTLFGPDTDLRRLYAIQSSNHSFSDARTELYAAMRASLVWLAGPSAPAQETRR
jgi:hypothetical protein